MEIKMVKEVVVDKAKWFWLFASIITALSIGTRFYHVTEPDHVCWDETHFGKMGSWYINRTFFFDVHPPLGKMLIALSGYLTGYDGTFPFDKPGDKYNGTNYEGMRIFCTALGASIIPMMYITVWEWTHSLQAAIFSSLLGLFDVGLLTLTQYILLDPILLCFLMASVLGMVKITANNYRAFSMRWWFWNFFTGTSLSCCLAVKFVGVFVILFVGFYTIWDLWNLLGDLSKPVMHTVKHLLARSISLIFWPAVLYIAIFYVHLKVLNKSGNGDGFYSSAFQSQLEGNSLYGASMPRYLAYGAAITLKNQRTGGGYLHSHHHLYPDGVGAKQQQITTYTHKDDNNKWLIKKYNSDVNNSAVELVHHGDLVRFEHIITRRNLHTHKVPAPVTKKHYQVTGYGENGTGDANDVWKIIVENLPSPRDDLVYTVTSRIRFVHYLQACVLTVSGKQLPKWAYEQQEVTCNPNLRDANALWNVEDNFYPKLPNVSFKVYAPSFWERFVESHAVMLQGNSGLKPKEGEITSRPWQWPINYRGQFFSGSQYRIYLLGNPVIWWSNIAFLLLFLLVFLVNFLKYQRGYVSCVTNSKKEIEACIWLFIGWCLHYIPFWGMGRVLYFHHYFPALLFSSMLTGILYSYMIETVTKVLPKALSSTLRHLLIGLFLSSTVFSFIAFSPLAYGISSPTATEPQSAMSHLRWLDSWEFF